MPGRPGGGRGGGGLQSPPAGPDSPGGARARGLEGDVVVPVAVVEEAGPAAVYLGLSVAETGEQPLRPAALRLSPTPAGGPRRLRPAARPGRGPCWPLPGAPEGPPAPLPSGLRLRLAPASRFAPRPRRPPPGPRAGAPPSPARAAFAPPTRSLSRRLVGGTTSSGARCTATTASPGRYCRRWCPRTPRGRDALARSAAPDRAPAGGGGALGVGGGAAPGLLELDAGQEQLERLPEVRGDAELRRAVVDALRRDSLVGQVDLAGVPGGGGGGAVRSAGTWTAGRRCAGRRPRRASFRACCPCSTWRSRTTTWRRRSPAGWQTIPHRPLPRGGLRPLRDRGAGRDGGPRPRCGRRPRRSRHARAGAGCAGGPGGARRLRRACRCSCRDRASRSTPQTVGVGASPGGDRPGDARVVAFLVSPARPAGSSCAGCGAAPRERSRRPAPARPPPPPGAGPLKRGAHRNSSPPT